MRREKEKDHTKERDKKKIDDVEKHKIRKYVWTRSWICFFGDYENRKIEFRFNGHIKNCFPN